MTDQMERVVTTTCASHCGGTCVLKLHVKDGVVVRVETDDGDEPQLRGCARGRGYRQRVYGEGRILYPLKRTGERGEGKFKRISWDEAIDTIAREIIRVRDTYGPASILYVPMGGDLGNLHTPALLGQVLALAGGYTASWGITSFQAGVYAQQLTYGTYYTASGRDDLVNSKFILMWGWNPAATISGTTTAYQLMKAREGGTRIVAVDPRFTDSAAVFADQWIAIRPQTDGAALAAMAYVIVSENLQDQRFLDTYTVGFDQFRDYILGVEDGVAKTPAWAEAITGLSASTIATLAREFARSRPAALIAGCGPGRTANAEQYHRMASTLAAMTGNVGIHGGDAAGRAWESIMGNYPYLSGRFSVENIVNPVDQLLPAPPKGAPTGYRPTKVHRCDIPDFIEKGKAGGFLADCKLMAFVNSSYVNAIPNVNKIVRALTSGKVEFIFVQEQYEMPTVKYADIVLPGNTYWERNDLATGVGLAFYGLQRKVIEPLGESKSHYEIVQLLARRMGLPGFEKSEEELIREMVEKSEIPSYEEINQKTIYRIPLAEPYVPFQKQIEDPANNPFPTPSGKIEIYSQRLAELNIPDLAPIPKYVEAFEGWCDPLRQKYPLQMISTHFKRRSNVQFDNLPWLRELEQQALMINTSDAAKRGIHNGDTVRVFNDRGEVVVSAWVTERIMPGVVDLPEGSWHRPDEKGVDHGACANVLVTDRYSPGGQMAYNTALVEVALPS